jgi:hypothetical protein
MIVQAWLGSQCTNFRKLGGSANFLRPFIRSRVSGLCDIKKFHKESLLAGQTVNSTYYCDILRWLRKNGRRLRPEPWRQKNWLLHHDNAPSHTSFFHQGMFYPPKIWLSSPSHPTHLIMAPCDFYVAPIEGKTERLSVWHSSGDRGRIAGGAEHPHRTQLPGWT